MAGAFITIDANTQPVLDALNALLAKTGDLKPAFEEIGAYLERSHDERWAAGEDPMGRKWESYAPLSPAYSARKPKNQGKILVLEGYLRDSLGYQTSDHALLFGTNSIYGATHQFGDEGRGIPARPFLGLSGEDEAEILEVISDYLLSDAR